MRALIAALLLLATSCSNKVDKADCKKMVAHMVDLLAKGERGDKIRNKVDNDASSSIEKTCVDKISRAQYDCVMKAKNFDDAAACDAK